MKTPAIGEHMTRGPYSVKSTDSLARARTLFDRHRIRHLPVIDGVELVGVLCKQDVAILEGIPGIRLEEVEVARLMGPALSVTWELPVDDAFDLMNDHHVDCLVVRNESGVVGIFTSTDALTALAGLVGGEAA